jgi:hypothetical protein
MSGGTAAVNCPQGKVPSVALTSDSISSATGVKHRIDNPSFFQSTVEILELINTLFSKFPVEQGALPSLQQL